MLCDPKWQYKAQSDSFSLASFIAWLEKQPPKRRYRYDAPDCCLVAQWLKSIGAARFVLHAHEVTALAGPMPTHQGLRSDDSDGPEHRWKQSIQQDQEQAIPICELDATPHPALQHNQLMTERRVLGLKSALRLEWRGEQGQEEAEQRDHRR